ncbi:hypothetical protein ACOMHN_049200 [Nucella lapillus]
MAALSKLTPRNSAVLTAAGLGIFLAYRHLSKNTQQKKGKKEEEIKVVIAQHDQKKEKAAVDGVFVRRMAKILKILVPGWLSMEVSESC